ncbi:MAG: hypothetical protein R8M11_06735 [Gallionella sp.]
MNKSILILAAKLSGKHKAPSVVGHPKHEIRLLVVPNPRRSTTVGIGSAHIKNKVTGDI